MMADFPGVQLLVYSFTTWFGLYLLARHPQKPGLRYAGLGLVAYAFGLEMDTLAGFMADKDDLLRFRPLIAVLPALFWLGAMRQLRAYDVAQPGRYRPRVLFTIGSIFLVLTVSVVGINRLS